MLKFTLKRFGYMLVTLFISITITFMLIHAIPGDPLASMARNLPPQIRANYYAKYGLNEPVIVQYGKFISNLVLHGDMGESLAYAGRSVGKTIASYAPISARIGGQAIALGFTIGVILGILAAFKRGKWPDYLVMFIAILGISVPSFVIASLLQFGFTVHWMILPSTGWGQFKHTILPTIALSFASIATYARYMRANCLDVIGQDYILTAKAKGVSKLSLVFKHVIRNAILPAITLLGPQIANIFIGSFVVESIFAIPGLGQYFVSAISDRDYTMIMGQTILVSALFIISLFVVDIVYGLVDPRIRVSNSRR
ncbi:binding--dependent transport system inner membrane component family protein [Clostridium argentinense CDC 2741]|uniref:Binding--dependent transport system inner membrane component family protein n=1 Tax=Clostridium argentinense CDC 2741 TaxID=1418104 RepID=A0A0C1TVH1_9CLOT|nr:ABC transporter permease [Clostridium argentinense]ARC84455.1 peptide ABC transporter permease [Clostridium argentinense]KIE44729.1 binding--dependent transport system inner membrane component family protein [Clostridium argentinense CDC 2741]NFF38763.1 ABC transporter permease [Clostridium argentinense]NFP48988.1 ABC transporter permease [Clostridium argentinense]NFP72555.1 ABC transporter permease [Clostridium argentinense]